MFAPGDSLKSRSKVLRQGARRLVGVRLTHQAERVTRPFAVADRPAQMAPGDDKTGVRSGTPIPWLADIVRLSAPDASGARVVEGWVVGPGRPPSVILTVGDRSLELGLTSAVARPMGLPDAWPVWEWRAVIPAGTDGELTLRSDSGRVLARRPPAGPVRKPSVMGSVDSPTQDEVVVGDVVEVQGWLLLNGCAPAHVDVEVEGAAPVRARLALPRPDIARSHPHAADAWFCGFQARVVVPPSESTREVDVRVTAFDADGPAWLAPSRSCRLVPVTDDPDDRVVARRGAQLTSELLNRITSASDDGHVFVVGHSLRVGGSELWLLELVRRLVRDHNYRVTLVSITDGDLRADFEELGIDVWVTGPRRISTAIGYRAFVSELALFARASGATSALLNTLDVFPAAEAMRTAGVPTAWVIHESFAIADHAYQNFGPGRLAPVVRAAWENSLASVEELLFVADSTRELFEAQRPVSSSRTIPYGIDMTHVTARTEAGSDAARGTLGIPHSAFLLLAVGISHPRKGHALLVQAFERVACRFPDAHLVIVGLTDNDYSQHLRKRVRCSGVADRISLVPVTRNVTQYFTAADVFVNSSDVESLPRTILESIAAGVPVLASDIFGARDLIVDGESGWLFRPSDARALTAGLIRALASDPIRRAAMADAARRAVEPFLDAAKYAADFDSLLSRIASTSRDEQGRKR